MPSPKGVQWPPPPWGSLTRCLPGGPLLCMLISISFCLCVASDSNLSPIRRPKLNPGRENSAESRARRRDDAASPALGARSLSSVLPISLSLDRIDSPTNSLDSPSVTANQMQWQLCSGGSGGRTTDKHLREWRTAADGMEWMAAAAAWHLVAGCLEPGEIMQS